MEWARRVHTHFGYTYRWLHNARVLYMRNISRTFSKRSISSTSTTYNTFAHAHINYMQRYIERLLSMRRARIVRTFAIRLRTLPYGTHMHSELRCIERKMDQQPHQSRTYISSAILANAITTTIAICIYFSIIHTTASKLNVKLANEDITWQNV